MFCILCPVFCVLYFILCSVFCVVYFVFYILCCVLHSVFCICCSVFYIVFCILCAVFCVLYSEFCILNICSSLMFLREKGDWKKREVKCQKEQEVCGVGGGGGGGVILFSSWILTPRHPHRSTHDYKMEKMFQRERKR